MRPTSLIRIVLECNFLCYRRDRINYILIAKGEGQLRNQFSDSISKILLRLILIENTMGLKRLDELSRIPS